MYGGILFDSNGLGMAATAFGMADGMSGLLCPLQCPSDCVCNSKWHMRHDRLGGFGIWAYAYGRHWYADMVAWGIGI